MAIEDNVYVLKYENVVSVDSLEVILFEGNRLHHYGTLDYDIEDVKAPEKIIAKLPSMAKDTLAYDHYVSNVAEISRGALYMLALALGTIVVVGIIGILLKSLASSGGISSGAPKCGNCKYLRMSLASPSGYDCSAELFKMTDPWHDACSKYTSK